MENIAYRLKKDSIVLGIALLLLLVLLPTNLKALGIIIASIIILANWFLSNRKINIGVFFTLAIFYIAVTLTIVYSSNLQYALNKLTTMSSLVVFPILFSLIPKQQIQHIYKSRKSLLWVFVVSVFLMNVIPFLWFKFTLYGWENMIEHFPTLLTGNMGKWSIHPIYASMHICTAILFSFFIWIENPKREKLFLLIVINLVLLFFLFLYSKKGPLFALLIVFSLFIVFQKQKRLFVPSILILTTLITLILIIPRTRERFSELMAIESVDSSKETSTNIRYSIYEATLTLIDKQKLLGYGIGDYNDILRKQFKKDKNSILVDRKYNTHNQYLSLWLSGGIFLLIIFVIAFGLNFVFAVRYDNQLLILLLIFYGIIMLTENILERESGVINFAFFISFFGLFNRELTTTT